jgi:hypothetical protein
MTQPVKTGYSEDEDNFIAVAEELDRREKTFVRKSMNFACSNKQS